jgi:hypothetical protein
MMADDDQSEKVDFNSYRRLTGAGTGGLGALVSWDRF